MLGIMHNALLPLPDRDQRQSNVIAFKLRYAALTPGRCWKLFQVDYRRCNDERTVIRPTTHVYAWSVKSASNLGVEFASWATQKSEHIHCYWLWYIRLFVHLKWIQKIIFVLSVVWQAVSLYLARRIFLERFYDKNRRFLCSHEANNNTTIRSSLHKHSVCQWFASVSYFYRP